MTLIAFAATPDRVDVLSDTLYVDADDAGRGFTYAPKTIELPNWHGVVAGTGAVTLFSRYLVHLVTMEATDLDDCAARSVEPLRRLWADTLKVRPAVPTHVYLIGWSAEQERTTGWVLSIDETTEREWRPWRVIGGTFDVPWMLSLTTDAYDETTDSAPVTDAEWIDVFSNVRRAASVDRPPDQRILVGGDVTRTTITAAGVEQRTIHTFDDTGAEWAAMLAGTHHADGPAHKWTGVGRNDPCPCRSGRKWKHCHDPRARVQA